jgi:hypothetical protein
MATVAHRIGVGAPRAAARPARPATVRRARKSIDQWNDREAGIAAVAVVGALAVVFALIIAGVVLYATTWGYGVSLG